MQSDVHCNNPPDSDSFSPSIQSSSSCKRKTDNPPTVSNTYCAPLKIINADKKSVFQRHPESFEMWCWRRMEISWAHHVRNEVLLRIKEQRNILHEISKRKANWIGHILRRNCLLQRVIEGKIKGGILVTGRRGRRRRKLLDDLKERRGYSNLKEEALDRTMWRAGFGRSFGPVVRQTSK